MRHCVTVYTGTNQKPALVQRDGVMMLTDVDPLAESSA